MKQRACANCCSNPGELIFEWCQRCRGPEYLCSSCAADPKTTRLGRRCANCSHSGGSSGRGGLVMRQKIGKSRTSS
jgi:hypothetical protein